MPRDNDKNNDSRGRRDRPSGGKGRSGAARGPEKKFAKRGFAGKSEGEKRPYAGKPDGERSYDKKPYAGAGKPYAGKREGRSDDRGGEKRPYTPRGDRPNYNRDDRAPRSDRNRDAGDARPAPPFYGNPIRPAKAAARSVPTPRVARVSGRTATGRAETVRLARGRRAMQTGRAAIGPRENSAATRNSRAERLTAGPARISAVARIGARISRRIAAIQSRGRSAMLLPPIMPAAIRDPRATVHDISTSRNSTSRASTGLAKTAAATSVRGSRARARIAPRVTVQRVTGRSASGRSSTDRMRTVRNSIGLVSAPRDAPTGRNIRAARRGRIGRAAPMRMTARSLPNVRPSAAAAPIVSISLNSTSARRVRRAKRNPASASPRWCRGRGWPRAATPRNGSCRAASRSTAA
jgi:hypothetical protein